jgi:hypothetical protein
MINSIFYSRGLLAKEVGIIALSVLSIILLDWAGGIDEYYLRMVTQWIICIGEASAAIGIMVGA